MGTVTAKRNCGGRSRCGSEDSAIGSEQEAEANLDLTAGIGKVTVAVRQGSEWRIKVQAWQIGGSHRPQATWYGSIRCGDGARRHNPVSKCLGAGHVCAIE